MYGNSYNNYPIFDLNLYNYCLIFGPNFRPNFRNYDGHNRPNFRNYGGPNFRNYDEHNRPILGIIVGQILEIMISTIGQILGVTTGKFYSNDRRIYKVKL